MLETLAPGWYVLCYHDVGWHEPRHLASLAISHPVDLFVEHVELCRSLGDIVSFDDGRAAVLAGDATRPTFSFTFDDGYRGVLEHAAPRLADLGVTAMAAINVPFVDGTEVFWRAKLSWIRHAGALEELRAHLAEAGLTGPSLRDLTMDHYGPRVHELIDAVYDRTDPDARADDRRRMHLTRDEVRALAGEGWVIANHSAHHLPLLEATAADRLEAEFEQNEELLAELLGGPTTAWVAPFDRPLARSPEALARLRRAAAPRPAVIVDDRRSDAADLRDGLVHRVFAPLASPGALLRQLRRAARRARTLPPHRRSGR